MTYKELIEECKKRGFTIVDDNGKFSVLDKNGKKHPLNSEEMLVINSPINVGDERIEKMISILKKKI